MEPYSDCLLPEYRLEIARAFCEQHTVKEPRDMSVVDVRHEYQRMRNNMTTLAEFLRTGIIPLGQLGSTDECAHELHRQLIPLINRLHRQSRIQPKRPRSRSSFHSCKSQDAENTKDLSFASSQILTPPGSIDRSFWGLAEAPPETSQPSDEEHTAVGTTALPPSEEDISLGAPVYIPTLGAQEVEALLNGVTEACDVDDTARHPCQSRHSFPAGSPQEVICCYQLPPSRRRCPLHGCILPYAQEWPTSRYMADDGSSDLDADCLQDDDRASKRRNELPLTLWEFLLECLHYSSYGNIISWLEKAEGTFKITRSQRLADMWGQHKRKVEMNFDKMSRAMRYYYKKGILIKQERGTRLVYKFGEALDWRSWKPREGSYPGRLLLPEHLHGSFGSICFNENTFDACSHTDDDDIHEAT